jgi:autotransporter-associated beta strand protein
MKTKMTVCFYLGLLVTSLQAATFTWNGGGTDSNWQTDANWSGGSKPASDGSAVLAFSGGARTSAANNFDADTAFAGINLLNDASSGKTAAFNLSGNRVTLGGNIVSTTATAAITDTLSLPMLLSNTRTVTQNNNHHLTISGVIGETGGSFGLTKSGGGTLKLTGANTFTGPVTNSAGYLYFNSIKTIGGGASALGAPTNVANGTLRAAGRLYYNGSSSATTDRPLVVSGDLQFFNETPGTTLTLNGGITGSSVLSFRGSGVFSVNGLIALGSADVGRTDNGTVSLNNAGNSFSGMLAIKDGVISTATLADGGQPCAIGLGTTIALGQNSPYNTTGTFRFTGAAGGSSDRAIRILSANSSTYGGRIENTVAGQTLTLSGPITVDSGASKPAPLWLTGAGNGVLEGPVDAGLRLVKTGSGTWTLSGANANTGSVTVSAGTLLLTSTLPAESAVSVQAGATFGGTGTVGGLVSVAAGGVLSPGLGGAGTLSLADTGSAALTLTGGTLACDVTGTGLADRLDVAGTLVLNGANVIALKLPDGSAPAGTYTLATYAALDGGSGTLALDRTYPNASLTVGETSVTLIVTGSGTVPHLTWVGDGAANLWDTTSENWTPSTYADGMSVVFDDTGSAAPAVSIVPVSLAPDAVTVSSATKAYTFNGGTLTGAGGLTKSGASLLTLNNANAFGGAVALNGGALTITAPLASAGITVSSGTVFTQDVAAAISGAGAGLTVSGSAVLLGTGTYTGATTVNTGGSLVLGGALEGSSIAVGTNAFFTQSAGSVIAGSNVTVTLQSNATLGGSNAFDGVATFGVLGTANLAYTLNNSNALGSTVGDTRLYGGTGSLLNRLYLGRNMAVTGERLTLDGSNDYRSGLAYNQNGGTGTWAGTIACIGSAYIESSTAGGTLALGADDSTVVTNAASCSLSMRGSGNIALNSRVSIGTGNSLLRNDNGTLFINATNNVWGGTGFAEGTIRLNVTNGLPTTTTLTIGKGDKKALCVFDMNGCDQLLSGLSDIHYAGPGDHSGTQRIVSSAPALLTVSNNSARSFGLEGSAIEGAVSLLKLGTATLTLTGTNSYSGATVVSNGTLAVSATGTLGTNSLAVTVGGSGTLALATSAAIADEAAVQMPAFGVNTAKIDLSSGVEETVGWLLYGDVFKSVGTYGATGSGADHIDNTHFAGSGRLRVLHSKAGVVFLLQ